MVLLHVKLDFPVIPTGQGEMNMYIGGFITYRIAKSTTQHTDVLYSGKSFKAAMYYASACPDACGVYQIAIPSRER